MRRSQLTFGAGLTALALSTTLTGCAGLNVTRINSEQAKPNNVWVFFTVERGEEPVAGLEASDFSIYEDEQLVSEFESKQTIINPEVAAVMYTLLLLDMSGSITESGEAGNVVDAAKMFTERVGEHQKVAVYAFDGSEDIYKIVPFTEGGGSAEGGLESLRTFKPKDPSTNLHGAVAQGLEELEKGLKKDDRPLKFGTLVVFTDGTDRAGRVTAEELDETVNQDKYANYDLYAIGVGAEMEESNLSTVGRDGTELADDKANVQDAFGAMADRIEAHTKRFYLLSYCTPARKGEHAVRIEAHTTNARGKQNGKGSLEYTFDAEDFGPPPECDPERKPKFKLDENLDAADTGGDDNGGGKKRKGLFKASGEVSTPGSDAG